MTSTSPDPRDIERDLERERASLASTLDALSDRVSVEHMASEALGMLKSHAGSATTTVDRLMRENPLAVALIGAGVAWLLLGKRPGSGAGSGASQAGAAAGAAPAAEAAPGGRAADGTGAAAADHAPAPTAFGTGDEPRAQGEDDWARQLHDLRRRAAEALRRLEGEARAAYRAFRGESRGAYDASGVYGGRDFGAEREGVIARFAQDLRLRLAAGLEALPEASRERIVAARRRAYEAMLRAERRGQQAVAEPARMLEEHPLAAAAVALALGAAVAAALPRTKAEDRAFGAERDRLMEEARRLLAEERERARAVAGALKDELRQAAGEVAQELRQVAGSAATPS
jgi:ElaB/YqjD/DUF883 family membrane-anchored ribosome-binding protein